MKGLTERARFYRPTPHVRAAERSWQLAFVLLSSIIRGLFPGQSFLADTFGVQWTAGAGLAADGSAASRYEKSYLSQSRIRTDLGLLVESILKNVLNTIIYCR